MIISPMKFKDLIWNYNPEKIKILSEKEIVESKIPMSYSDIQNFGRMARVIKGEGSLFGSDCFSQFDKLWQVYREDTAGMLSIPEFAVMQAMFTSLYIVGEPTDSLITYSFTFTEIMGEEQEESFLTSHTVIEGESLWDVSNRYNIPIDELVALNPSVQNPFMLKKGDEVVLC